MSLVYDLEAWELYDEFHRRQRVKLSVDIKEQIAQMYFQARESKDVVAVRFNVSRRAVCRVLAEWNEIGRAFHLLESRLWITGYNNEDINVRLNCLLYLI